MEAKFCVLLACKPLMVRLCGIVRSRRSGVRGWRWSLKHRRPTARARLLCRLFSRTSQAGSVDRPLFGRLGDAGLRLEIDFFCGAETLAAVNLHGLDAHHLIANHSHEIHVLGRLAIDPLLVFDVSILLTNLLGWATLGVNQHLTVHADQNLMVLDGFLHLGWNRIEISLDG